jgi:hypothetical protein
VGIRKATVSISNNSANASGYYFIVSGTATTVDEPVINLKQNSINIASETTYIFNPVVRGDTSGNITFVIENTGTATLTLTGNPDAILLTGTDVADFLVAQPPVSSIAPSQNTSFTVSFDPETLGSKTASLWIESDDGDKSPYVIPLSGESIAAPAPGIEISSELYGGIELGGAYDFGIIEVGDYTSAKFTITNTGTADLLMTAIPFVQLGGDGGAAFNVDTQPSSTVSAGSTTDFWVTFSPTAAASYPATATIQNNSDIASFEFDLTGNGLAAGTVSPPEFTPPEGYYKEAQNVVLTTATSQATIHYTTDCVTQPSDISPAYGGTAIPVPDSPDETTIKAIAIKDTFTDSVITEGHYIIDLFEPAVTVDGGIEGSIFDTPTPTITGIATDNKAIDTVEVKIIEGVHSYFENATAYEAATIVSGDELSATWEYTLPDTPDDIYTISVLITDMSGRTTSTTVSFTIATDAVWDDPHHKWDVSLWASEL